MRDGDYNRYRYDLIEKQAWLKYNRVRDYRSFRRIQNRRKGRNL